MQVIKRLRSLFQTFSEHHLCGLRHKTHTDAKMPNCINKRCVLLNLVYNLALNNLLSGVGVLFQGSVQELSNALIMVGLGVLLVVGVRKENRSLLLTFLILEPFLLGYHTVKGSVEVVHYVQGTNPNFGLFNIIGIAGNVCSWILLISVYIVYKDISVIQRRDESKVGCPNESKSVAV